MDQRGIKYGPSIPGSDITLTEDGYRTGGLDIGTKPPEWLKKRFGPGVFSFSIRPTYSVG